MKKLYKSLIAIIISAVFAVPALAFAGCTTNDPNNKPGNKPDSGIGDTDKVEHVDYVSQLHLDFTTDTKKQEVTVKTLIDGDTTHFYPVTKPTYTDYNADDFKDTYGIIKARYLAINTPESTSHIEEWGKKASAFTKSKLEDPKTTIVVESDKDYWDIDSTGERYLLWVWYKPEGETEFRNLNVEILQEGLAYASRTNQNIYGDIATKALQQAQREKLNCYSGEQDPDYYYGPVKVVSLKELRCFPDKYLGAKVSVIGNIVAQFSNSVYIESYDEESEVYFGMQVFYGYNPGNLLQTLRVGNKVEVVGNFEYSSIVDAYQISGLAPYDPYEPDLPTNCKVLETGVEPSFTLIEDHSLLTSGKKVKIATTEEDEDGNLIEVEMLFPEACMSTSVSLENLTVYRVSTTSNGGDSDGAMTLYCTGKDANGNSVNVQVRTEVLKDANGNLMTEKDYINQTINVKGIIEKYYGNYQIKVYRTDFITVL